MEDRLGRGIFEVLTQAERRIGAPALVISTKLASVGGGTFPGADRYRFSSP
jgi:hypothetical protein